MNELAGQTGLEPATSGVTDQHSNRLSYYPETLLSESFATLLRQSFHASYVVKSRKKVIPFLMANLKPEEKSERYLNKRGQQARHDGEDKARIKPDPAVQEVGHQHGQQYIKGLRQTDHRVDDNDA